MFFWPKIPMIVTTENVYALNGSILLNTSELNMEPAESRTGFPTAKNFADAASFEFSDLHPGLICAPANEGSMLLRLRLGFKFQVKN